MIALFLLTVALIAEAGLGFRNVRGLARWARGRATRTQHALRGCPGPFVRVRSELVARVPVHCEAEFWLESQLHDVRVRCPECGRIHQLHTRALIRHET